MKNNTEELNEMKNVENIKEKEEKNEEIEDFKILNDEIFDIINDIQNTEENPNMKLAEDEFKDMADHMIINLYENKGNNDDFDENDDEIKTIVNTLNNMNPEDRMKTVDLLEKKADNDVKKRKFYIIQKTMGRFLNTVRLIKNIINKQKKDAEEEKQKMNDLNNDNINILRNQSFSFSNNNNFTTNTNNINNSNNISNNVSNSNFPNFPIEDIGTIDLDIKPTKTMENDTALFFLDKLRNKKLGPKDSIKKLISTSKCINKFKYLRNSASNNKINLKDILIKRDNEAECLNKDKLKTIIKQFEKDLYEKKEEPLTRKEVREYEKDNNEKLKKILKVIDSLNILDQEEVLNKLKSKAIDHYKKTQFNKLYNRFISLNNYKIYNEKLKEKDDDNNNEKKKELTKTEMEELNNVISVIDNNNDEKNSGSLEDWSEIISHFNLFQQSQILDSLKNNNVSEDYYEKLENNVDFYNKMKKLVKLSSKESNNIKNDELPEEKQKKGNVELDDNDLINITEAIFCDLFENEKYRENLFVNELDKYLLKKEREQKFNDTINMLQNLKKEDIQLITGTLSYIIDNYEQLNLLNEINKKMGITYDNKAIDNIISTYEHFKNDDEIEMMKDDKLAKLTDEIITNIMTDSNDNDKEKMDKLNKAANTIIIMNRNDQEKILFTLKDFAKTEKQKETMYNVERLVENLNYMIFYLYNVNQKKINDYKTKNNDLIRNSIISQFFNEDDQNNNTLNKGKNIDKLAFRLSLLNKDDQNQILSEINKRTNEKGNNNYLRKTIDKLNDNLSNLRLTKAVSSLNEKKQKNVKKKKVCDNDIKYIADNINDVLCKEKKTNNYTEQLLFNQHKEGKINQITQSIYNNFDEESKRKTISYLNLNFKNNDKNKKQINIINDSILNKNNKYDDKNKSGFSSQFFMLNTLGGTELNEDELNILIDTFCKDLFNDEIIDNNKKEDNLNLIANLIKELHEENQNKVFEKLENKPEAKNNLDLIDNLREKVLRLRVLKDELSDKQYDKSLIDFNRSRIINNSDVEDLLENEEDDDNDVDDQTMIVEISVDDIDQEDLNEICQVFKVDLEVDDGKKGNEKEKEDEKEKEKEKDDEKEKEDEKVNENEKEKEKEDEKVNENEKQKEKQKEKENRSKNKKVHFLADNLAKMDDKTQKKITNKLKENLNNENEKQQFTILMDKIKKINIYKNYGKEIKEKRKAKYLNKLWEDIKEIKKLNNGGLKNLDKAFLDQLEKEAINILYNKKIFTFEKNEEIENYLSEAMNNGKILYIAEKINALSVADKFELLTRIEKTVDCVEKNDQYNKLYSLIDNLGKLKDLNEPIKKMENKIDSFYKNNNINTVTELSANNLEIKIKQIEEALFDAKIDNNDININIIIYKISESIKKLSSENQNFILQKLKEKADNDEKQIRIKKLEYLLEKNNKLINFKKKVMEKHMNRLVFDQLEKEKKYGIFVENDDISTMMIKKPKELKKNKLKEIKNKLIADLCVINEEEIESEDIDSLNKYLKEKDNEKKFEEISDVIISLDNNDKEYILEEIKNNFDNPKQTDNVYNQFVKILARRKKHFDNERIKKQKETIREIEETKKNDEDALLYSFIEEITHSNSSDIVGLIDDKSHL